MVKRSACESNPLMWASRKGIRACLVQVCPQSCPASLAEGLAGLGHTAQVAERGAVADAGDAANVSNLDWLATPLVSQTLPVVGRMLLGGNTPPSKLYELRPIEVFCGPVTIPRRCSRRCRNSASSTAKLSWTAFNRLQSSTHMD